MLIFLYDDHEFFIYMEISYTYPNAWVISFARADSLHVCARFQSEKIQCKLCVASRLDPHELELVVLRLLFQYLQCFHGSFNRLVQAHSCCISDKLVVDHSSSPYAKL